MDGQNISFIPRLYTMVNDASIPQIVWSKSGHFFVIRNPEEFAQVVLPVQFKHNNFASFVRQLNMYGFHKVTDLDQLANRGDPRAWAFEHPGFVRGRPELLQNIHRKPKSSQKKQQLLQQKQEQLRQQPQTPASPAPPARPAITPEQQKKADVVIEEILQTKLQQRKISAQFDEVQKEREALWREYAQTQKKLYEQQEVTRQVLSFLMAVSQQPQFAAAKALPPAQLRITDESSPAPAAISSMEVDSAPSSPVSEAYISSVLHDEQPAEEHQPQAHYQQRAPSPSLHAEFNSFLHAPPPAPVAVLPFEQDFVSELYQFEDSYVTPYCSMEEDVVWTGLNAPLNWVPS